MATSECGADFAAFMRDPFNPALRDALLRNADGVYPKLLQTSRMFKIAALYETFALADDGVAFLHEDKNKWCCVSCVSRLFRTSRDEGGSVTPRDCDCAVASVNVRRLCVTNQLSIRADYVCLSELALVDVQGWGAAPSSISTEQSLGLALSKLPSLVSLALGNVYDVSRIVVECTSLRSLAVRCTDYWTLCMPHLVRFTSEQPLARMMRKPCVEELALALAGSTSLTAIRMHLACCGGVTDMLQKNLPLLPRIKFLVMTLTNEHHMNSANSSLRCKCSNILGSMCAYRTIFGNVRIEFSNWFYVGVWSRGEAKHVPIPSGIASWITYTSPGWLFGRVVLALTGWLRQDIKEERFDPRVLANYMR